MTRLFSLAIAFAPLIFVFFVPEILKLSFFTRALRLSITIVAMIGFYLPLFRSNRGATLGLIGAGRLHHALVHARQPVRHRQHVYRGADAPGGDGDRARLGSAAPRPARHRHPAPNALKENFDMITRSISPRLPDRLGHRQRRRRSPGRRPIRPARSLPSLALRAEPRRQHHAAAAAATRLRLVRRHAGRHAGHLGLFLPPGAGRDQWSAAEQLSDDPTRSEQNPVLFPAPDGRCGCSGPRRWPATRTPPWSAAASPATTARSGARSRRCSPSRATLRRLRPPAARRCSTTATGCCRSSTATARPGEKWVGNDDTSAVMISYDGGATWREVEVPGQHRLRAHEHRRSCGDGSLLALFRSRWADNIYESRSTDDGRTWSAPVPTALPNNNSSIQFTRARERPPRAGVQRHQRRGRHRAPRLALRRDRGRRMPSAAEARRPRDPDERHRVLGRRRARR